MSQRPPGNGHPTGNEDLAAEREYVAALYARLDELRDRTSHHLSRVRTSSGGTPQWLSERDALARTFEDRLAGFAVGDLPLCFGRLDMTSGAKFHIGRLALSDDHHEPLLVDWRAPAAQPFYQATPGDPQDVVRRRHLLTRGREVIGLDDEVFDLDSLTERERAGLQGDAALLASLTRSRTGHMGDIIATIQAEQDRIIRADLAGVLVVQGGPGTGKTVVALHRAAYLLYTHRRRLEGTGVLIVAPNGVFLRYIEQVLPSLGETGALLLTPGELFPGVRATRSDPPAVARVKGDPRMVRVLRKAIEDRQRVPRSDIVITFEHAELRLTRQRAREIRAAARRTRRPHNRARQIVERMVLDTLMSQMPAEVITRYGPESDVDGANDVRAVLRRGRPFRELMERLWPQLTPQELLNDLFGFAALLRSAAPHLDEGERALLLRERSPNAAEVDWSVEDVPLLDEAAELLGEGDLAHRGTVRSRNARRRRREVAFARDVLRSLDLAIPLDPEQLAERFGSGDSPEALAERARLDRTWAFGHLIVDEAQELSPMAWRVLFRRNPSRSMTIVGDLAQGGVSWRPRRWADVFDRHARDRWRAAELTVNYRTPREIMEIAAAVLAAADPSVEPPLAMRDSGERPWTRPVPAAGSVVAATVAAVGDELAAVADGRLAVITPTGLRDDVEAALRSALPAALEGGLLDATVTVLPVREVKGLEFDSVVIVEPARIRSESELGLSDLYVALTRSTRRLGIVHQDPLPAEMAGLA